MIPKHETRSLFGGFQTFTEEHGFAAFAAALGAWEEQVAALGCLGSVVSQGTSAFVILRAFAESEYGYDAEEKNPFFFTFG